MAKRALPATVVLLGITSFFTDAASEMIVPLLPMFLGEKLLAGVAMLGLIEGAADAVAGVLKLYAGRWSDRVGRRKPFVVAGYALAGLVRPFVAFATAPWHVLAIRVTDRVGKGLRSAPRDALLSTSAPAGEEGRAFGFHRAMDHAGSVVGPLVATGLLAWGVSLETIFFGAMVPGILAFVAVTRVKDTAVAPAPRLPEGPVTPVPPLSPRLRSLLALVGLFALANASDTFLLVRARELGVPGALLPMMWVVLHVAKSLATWWGGGLADRHSKPLLVAAGWAIYAASYLGFALADQPWMAWALLVPYAGFYGLTEPAEKALVKSLAPPGGHGRAFGAYHLVVGLGALPAGLAAGSLWDHFGAPTALFSAAAVALVAAVFVWLWAGRGTSSQAAAGA